MNSANDQRPAAGQFSNTAPQKCFVCKYVIEEPCFCRIFRTEEAPILLCCPECTNQYIDSTRIPADSFQEELLAYEKKSNHFFIGANKPWL
jgi:hypothetical protein